MSLFKFKENPTPIPPTRFLQFFYLIKENFLLFFTTSICQFISSLPAIYILISTYIRYSNELNAQSPNSIILYQILVNGALLLLPCLLISSIGEIGMYSIVKKVCFNEPTEFKDFFRGIKTNYLPNILIIVATAIFSSLIIINYGTYLYANIEGTFKLISLIVSLVLFLLTLIVKPFFILQKLNFNNSTIQIIKNSIAFLFSKLFRNLGILIVSNILIILLLFSANWIRVMLIVLLIILGGAYSVSVQYLHSLSVVELFIDKKTYPEIYHNGLNDFYNKRNET